MSVPIYLVLHIYMRRDMENLILTMTTIAVIPVCYFGWIFFPNITANHPIAIFYNPAIIFSNARYGKIYMLLMALY